MTSTQNATGSTTIRVFLVEDSRPVRELIVENCTAIPGIRWTGFSDSEMDALEQLEDDTCDVLIVDIELREGNGISLLRKLAEEGRDAAGLKIVFSNNICEAYRRVGEKYGVDHFLDKSFEMPALCLLLQQHRAALMQRDGGVRPDTAG